MTLTEKLARLQNRSTRYELAVKHPDGRAYLVTYAQSRTRHIIMVAVNNAGTELVKLTGSKDITFAKKAKAGATIGEWKIVWTGRTQRQAYCEGELTFILDIE